MNFAEKKFFAKKKNSKTPKNGPKNYLVFGEFLKNDKKLRRATKFLGNLHRKQIPCTKW